MENEKSTLSLIGKIFDWLGKAFLKTTPGKLFALFVKTILSFFSANRNFRTDFRNVVLQTFFTGVEIFPILFVVASLFGTVVIVETMSIMSKVGFANVVGNVLVVTVVRELGPIFTAFLIAGRSGSALATMIGNMQINSEIDALSSMGISPIRYLVMPSLLGGVIAVFIMSICFCVSSLGMGYLISKIFVMVAGQTMNVQLTWNYLYTSLVDALTFTDFVMIVLKPLVFGIIIVINACYQGLRVERDFRNLPKATSRSVIFSFLYIVIADAMLSVFFIFQYLGEISKII